MGLFQLERMIEKHNLETFAGNQKKTPDNCWYVVRAGECAIACLSNDLTFLRCHYICIVNLHHFLFQRNSSDYFYNSVCVLDTHLYYL